MSMEEKKKQMEVIDLRVVAKKVWSRRKLFYKALPIAFVLSCIYILSIPRYYTTDVKLAPEMESSFGGGTLGDIASSFGIDLGNMQTSDAITPLLYPDLMEDNGFVTGMFDIRVKSADGEIDTTYKAYLRSFQEKAWWKYPIDWVKKQFQFGSSKNAGAPQAFDPYYLSKRDDATAASIRNNVNINVDKQTAIITINTTAQDPLICKTLADSIKDRLQDFITEYRTNKARTDYEYYKNLTAEAKREYEKVRQQYASMSDASTNVSLRSVELKMEDMENEMQLKFNAYTALNNQLQASKAKVQEKTPAFTVIKGASVPMKPSGPKRMIFVLGMLILTGFGCVFYILKDDIKARLIG